MEQKQEVLFSQSDLKILLACMPAYVTQVMVLIPLSCLAVRKGDDYGGSKGAESHLNSNSSSCPPMGVPSPRFSQAIASDRQSRLQLQSMFTCVFYAASLKRTQSVKRN